MFAGYNLAYTKGESTDAVLGLMRILMEADVLCDLGVIWLLGDFHKWFDIIRRDVVSAKLDALGVPAEVSRVVLTIYHNQRCRQATAHGLSTGRLRGPTG